MGDALARSPQALLEALRNLGFTVVADGSQLKVSPAGVLPEALRAELLHQKPAVLDLLRPQDPVEERYERWAARYDELATQINAVTDAAVAARERGDLAEYQRLISEQMTLIEGDYAVARRRLGELDPYQERSG